MTCEAAVLSCPCCFRCIHHAVTGLCECRWSAGTCSHMRGGARCTKYARTKVLILAWDILSVSAVAPTLQRPCDLAISAVQELEDCCRGSLMNISVYQHKRECKRALEQIDTCIEVRQALADQAAAAAQNPTNTTEAPSHAQEPTQPNL